jgi:hypothetical protein
MSSPRMITSNQRLMSSKPRFLRDEIGAVYPNSYF